MGSHAHAPREPEESPVGSMPGLDDPVWDELDDAYGTAGKIPALLRGLPGAPAEGKSDAEPWFSLWSALAHQNDVYSASYAAVPHILEAAAGRRPEDRAQFLTLVGWIEICRRRPTSPKLRQSWAAAYAAALHRGAGLAIETLLVVRDPDWYRGVIAALAAFQGHTDLAGVITYLDERMACSACGEGLGPFKDGEPG